jgi:uncharacterized protein (UPF0332 family)
MAAYLNKARTNIKSAQILMNKGLAIPSAHPAYYSAFLLLKYVLAHYGSINYTQQEALSNSKDSHTAISKRALPILVSRDPDAGNDYFERYNKLKMIRKKADYKPVEMKDILLQANLKDAEAFLSDFESHFNL